MTSHYIRSDGNGGFAVSKSIIVATSFIVLLLSVIVPSVMAYATMENRISAVEKQTAELDLLTVRTTLLEKEVLVTGEKLTTIKSDIVEIKQDIKDIKTYIQQSTV